MCTGNVTRLSNDTVEISELPIGRWTKDYKDYLMKMADRGGLRELTENHTENSVSFLLRLRPDAIDSLERSGRKGGLARALHLERNISLSNMHAFDGRGRLRKFHSPLDIIDEYWPLRLGAYRRRRDATLHAAAVEERMARSKAQFISDVQSGRIFMVDPTTQRLQVILLFVVFSHNNHIYAWPSRFSKHLFTFSLFLDMK